MGVSAVCHDYEIFPDETCDINEKTTHFEILLSVTSTDRLIIDQLKSTATVAIDDSMESECCESWCSYIVKINFFGSVFYSPIRCFISFILLQTSKSGMTKTAI